MKRIAFPLANERLCMHFGHCEKFAFIDIDETTGKIFGRTEAVPPPHEPGILPPWVAQQGAHMVIAGGMGQRARMLFEEQGLEVLVGAPAETPETLAAAWHAGTLVTGTNACDH